MTNVERFISSFKIIQEFKKTGQKQVYLAESKDTGKVVLKIGKSPSESRLKRAKREVDIQKALRSPFYPEIYQFIIFDNFQFVIVEEYINSKPLSASHADFSNPKQILALLKDLVDGLTLLWKSKVTHRDLKPDNILIRSNGKPVIIDLGIALAIDMTDLTSPCALRGPCTPIYAAPEQLKNRRAEIDHRTDQFILGIDIMELFGKGNHPFDPNVIGVGASIPENIVNGNWNKELLKADSFTAIKDLVSRLLETEPYKRFRNPELLMQEIHRCCGAYL